MSDELLQHKALGDILEFATPEEYISNIKYIYKNSTQKNETAFQNIAKLCDECIRRFDKKLSCHSLGILFFYTALSHKYFGKFDEMYEEMRTAATYFELAGDKKYLSESYHECGFISLKRGHYAEALDYMLRALDLFAQIDNNGRIAATLTNIGTVQFQLGDFASSIDYYERALEVKKKLGDRLGESLVIGNIGCVYQEKEDFQTAIEFYKRSLEIKEELNNITYLFPTLANLGTLYAQSGDFERAFAMLFRAKNLACESNNIGAALSITGYIGQAYFLRGDFDDALLYLNEVLENISNIDVISRRHDIYSQLFDLYANTNFKDFNLEIARSYLLKALNISLEYKEQIAAARYYQQLSKLEQQAGNFQKALEYLRTHIDIKDAITTKAAEDKLQSAQVKNRVEHLRRETQMERLRNIELARANEKLAELNNEKNTILGIVAHDLKNPLGAIKLAADFLRDQANSLSPDDAREFASDILQTSSYMFAIITQLLDYNALETGKFQISLTLCNIATLIGIVAENYRRCAENKDIAFRLNIPDEFPDIEIDEHRLREILENLISNAIKFSPPHLTVEITAEETEDQTLRISVKDQGPGISPEDLTKLFGKFQKLTARPTAGEHSTGLGLSIVKKLVELLDGHVWCESRLGEGANFIVELPLRSKK